LTNFLSDLVPGDPSYDAALCFIQGQGITLAQVLAGNVSESVNQAFATMLAEHYYQITSAALKKYDPNHLNLGSRLNGRTRSIEGVVKSSAKWCDVVSVNFYDSYSPDVTITSTSKYLKWIDAPCMVGEFYVKGLDATNAGFVNGYSGAGWVVKTQAERGYFYQNTCLELLKSKIYVGWHYFKFRDDSNSNKGIVKTSSKGGEEYTELTSQMSLVNNNIFKLINYYDNTSEVEIPTKQNISFYLTKNNLVVKNIPAQSTLRIFELSGRLLKIFPLNQGENQCPLPGLIRGLYTLEVKGKGMQTVYTSKLIL